MERLWDHGCAKRSFRPGVPVCITQIDRNHITVFLLFYLRKNTILAAWLIALIFFAKREVSRNVYFFLCKTPRVAWFTFDIPHLLSRYTCLLHTLFRVYPGVYQCNQRFPKLSLNSINLVKKIQESQGWDRDISCVAKQCLIPSTT